MQQKIERKFFVSEIIARCTFQECLAKFIMLLVGGSHETGLFRNLCIYVFRVRNFQNKKSMRVIFFFKIFKIFIEISKMRQKIEKKVFPSEKIGSEWVLLNCLY